MSMYSSRVPPGSALTRQLLPKKSTANTAVFCQKCYGKDHWTYECKQKNPQAYKSRPSRTQQLNDDLAAAAAARLNARIQKEQQEQQQLLEAQAALAKKSEAETANSPKRRRRHSSSSSSDSSDSSTSSSTDTSSDSDASSSASLASVRNKPASLSSTELRVVESSSGHSGEEADTENETTRAEDDGKKRIKRRRKRRRGSDGSVTQHSVGKSDAAFTKRRSIAERRHSKDSL